MSTRGGYSGRQRRQTAALRIEQTGGKVTYVERRIIDQIKEATEASEEDIEITLRSCGGDVNEATEKLIESPFKVVKRKKDDRKRPERGPTRSSNVNARSVESGGNRGGRQTRDGRGGHAGAQNGQRAERSRGGGRGGGALRTGGRQRTGEERKEQDSPYTNGVHEKEAEAPDVASASVAPERGGATSSAAQPIPPAIPRKTGYADALRLGIGLNQPTRTHPTGPGPVSTSGPSHPSGAGRAPMDSSAVASAPEPTASEPSAQPPATATTTRPEVPSEPTPPVAEENEAPPPAEPIESPQPAVDTSIPAQPLAEPPAPSEPEGWDEVQAMESRFGQMPTTEELAVPIKGPNFENLSVAQEEFASEGLPAYPAPAVDLSLENPPSFELSGINLKFGSFAGVDDPGRGAEEAAAHAIDYSVVAGDNVQLEMNPSEPASSHAQLAVDPVVEPQVETVPASDKFDESQELAEDRFITSVSAPPPEREPEPILTPPIEAGMENVGGSLALPDVYAPPPPVEEVPIETKADASTQVVVQEPEPPKQQIPEPSCTSTGVQHSSYNPAPAMMPPQGGAMPDYAKAVEKSSFQPPQFTVDLQEQASTERKQAQQPYTVEGQVGPVHHQRQPRHQTVQEQRAPFEAAQHTPNPSPSLPPYPRHDPPKQDQGSTHPAHPQHARFVGQVSAGAQTDASTAALGNQPPQAAATAATPSSGAPAGVAMAPPVAYGSMLHNHGLPFPHYYPHTYIQPQYNAMAYHSMYPGNFGFNGGFSHGAESSGFPAPHVPPGATPQKYLTSYNPSGVGANSVNQGYGGNYATNAIYGGLGGNTGYEASGGMTGGYAYTKEKDNLPQPGQQHSGYGPGIGQQVPRNEMYYVPQQGYNAPGQAFRNAAYHQGYGGQYSGGGYAAPPHTFHNVNAQQSNFGRLH